MAMSGVYGPADRQESIATIHAALDGGITLLDTGDFYGMGHNEMLIGEALTGRAGDRPQISVKFGALRDAAGGWLGIDGRPAAVKNFLAYSLQRLNLDHIDVYRLARVDPAVPIEETVGAIGELIRAGYVRYVGLSEAGADTIARAHDTHPICDLQIEYSLFSRGIESAILPACRERGIAITAYGILSRGLLGGGWSAARSARPGDWRSTGPRFAEINLERNLQLVQALESVAAARGTTVARLATAWVLAQGPDIIPLAGARTRTQLHDALAAAELVLDERDLAAIEAAIPKGSAAGARYPEMQMAHLDSER
jgi:aryl-alcohol dehydrogenase-like predicted oxidoreductase